MVDHVKKHKVGLTLEPQDASPSNAQEGQMQMASASHATLSQGMYRYDGTEWKAAGGGVGSLTLIKAYKSNDDGTGDFTVKSIDSLLPDFAATDTLAASFSGSSTGDALFSNDNADKVYNLKSAASSQYDAVGFDLSIPKYARGKDIGFSMFFRTKDVSGDSANADYMVWIFDKTNGIQTTTIDTGAIAAGTSINITTSTGMSVGQKIFVEEASQVVETHITAIADSTHVTLSDAVTLATGDLLATGILTDTLTTLKAADSDTNEIGEKFQVTFLPPEDCAEVTFMVQQLTSETDSELYFDALGFDSDIYKTLSTVGNAEEYRATGHAGFGSTDTAIPYYTTASKNTINSLGVITNNSTNGFIFTATKRCEVHLHAYSEDAASSAQWGITLNSTELTTHVGSQTDKSVVLDIGSSPTANTFANTSAGVVMEVGDAIRVHTDAGIPFGNDSTIVLLVKPQVNESVIVESSDSVVSAWEAYTPEFTGLGTTTLEAVSYRRVGDSAEFRGKVTSGTPTATEMRISFPNGLLSVSTIDTLELAGTGGIDRAVGSHFVLIEPSVSYFTFGREDATGAAKSNGNDIVGVADVFNFTATVPIAGWSANNSPLLALPTITVGQEPEMYRTNDALGYGSSNTYIPYYKTTPLYNTISLLGTIENSSTNGFSFTATKRCTVNLSVMGAETGSNVSVGISLNSGGLSTGIDALTDGSAVCQSVTSGSGIAAAVSAEVIMEPGDIIRPHFGSVGTLITADDLHAITLVAKPILGQSNQAAIIAQPVAFVEDRKAIAVNGGTSSITPTARDLNTLSGDIAAVSVELDGTDGFKLTEAGKFIIEWTAPGRAGSGGDRFQTALYNETTSTYIKMGSNEFNDSATGAQTSSTGQWSGVLPSNTILSIHHETQQSLAGTGLGLSSGSVTTITEYELYTQVKITRLK